MGNAAVRISWDSNIFRAQEEEEEEEGGIITDSIGFTAWTPNDTKPLGTNVLHRQVW